MILVKFLLLVSIFFIYFCKVLEYLYRFQIKEYRWDRLWSSIKEQGAFRFLYTPQLIFPAKKVRNIAIAGFLLVIGSAYCWILYQLPIELIILNILLAPVAAFIDVTALVLVTNLPVKIYRERIIAKAKKKMGESSAKVIMITGSYGKTSIKEYLYDLLKEQFHVAKTDNNMNTDIGVAMCILKNLKQNTQYFIAEVGAYRVGEIAKICHYVKPDYVIVTAFGNQHLDLYGSHANLVKAESEPLAFLKEDGIAFINKDILEYETLTKNASYIVRDYSMTSKQSYIHAIGTKSSEKGTNAAIYIGDSAFSIQIKLLGNHSIQNLLPVMGLAKELGMSDVKIKSKVQEIEQVKHKLSLHNGIKGSVVISDSVNSNVHGFLEAIHIASSFSKPKKILATKGIIELGKERVPSYKKISKALESTDIVLYTTDPLLHSIRNDTSLLFKNEDLLLEKLKEMLDSGSLLVLEGKFTEGFVKKVMSKKD